MLIKAREEVSLSLEEWYRERTTVTWLVRHDGECDVATPCAAAAAAAMTGWSDRSIRSSRQARRSAEAEPPAVRTDAVGIDLMSPAGRCAGGLLQLRVVSRDLSEVPYSRVVS